MFTSEPIAQLSSPNPNALRSALRALAAVVAVGLAVLVVVAATAGGTRAGNASQHVGAAVATHRSLRDPVTHELLPINAPNSDRHAPDRVTHAILPR